MGICDSGMTFGQMANMQKERIKHALEGEKCAGEDENGIIWVPCSDEDADTEILTVFDECVKYALDAMHERSAFEKISVRHGYKHDQVEYENAMMETELSSEYVFEGEQADVPDSEIDEI